MLKRMINLDKNVALMMTTLMILVMRGVDVDEHMVVVTLTLMIMVLINDTTWRTSRRELHINTNEKIDGQS